MFGIKRWTHFLYDGDEGAGGGGDAGDGIVAAAGAGGGEGGAGGGESEEGGGFDIESAFSSFRDDITSRFEGIESRLTPDGDEGDEGDDEEIPHAAPARQPLPAIEIFDVRNFADDDFDEDGHLTPDAYAGALEKLVESKLAEARAPEIEARMERDRTDRANALEQKYPILADPVKREPILAEARRRANAMARSTGNPALRDAWRDPEMIELATLAHVGGQAAAGESSAGSGRQDVVLESGGSAGPAGGSDDAQDAGDRIVKLAGKSKFRLGAAS